MFLSPCLLSATTHPHRTKHIRTPIDRSASSMQAALYCTTHAARAAEIACQHSVRAQAVQSSIAAVQFGTTSCERHATESSAVSQSVRNSYLSHGIATALLPIGCSRGYLLFALAVLFMACLQCLLLHPPTTTQARTKRPLTQRRIQPIVRQIMAQAGTAICTTTVLRSGAALHRTDHDTHCCSGAG